MNDLAYRSQPITVDQIIKEGIFFKIPIYQRLYVWEKEQIHALLSDIVSSYQKNNPGEDSIFYLGNVIVKEDVRDGKTFYELIDGQQRFTTLWLLSIYLQNDLKEYAFPENGAPGKKDQIPLRIEFDIRDQVSEFMREIVEHYDDYEEAPELDLEYLVQKNPEKGFDTGALDPLANAFKEIDAFFTNYLDEEQKEEISSYIRNQVQMVKTIVPDNADLNKLFEVLNNRGVQLEHHQILKARILETMHKGREILEYSMDHYATLWDSCSGMNEFIEKGFQDATGKRLTELESYTKVENYTIYKDANTVLGDLKRLDHSKEGNSGVSNQREEFDGDGLRLQEVLNKELSEEEQSDQSDEDVLDERSQEIKSIINFPMFLQHTLRIYLKERGWGDIERILDKELLHTFEEYFFERLDEIKNEKERAREVAAFIQLLWEVRFVFDEYIVKWIKDESTDILKLCKLYEKPDKDKIYLYRQTKEYKPELSQLQRQLYHSQEMRTFYWLTPFLYFLHSNYKKLIKDDRVGLDRIYLQYLDNHLLNIDTKMEDDPLIERTSVFMDEIKNQNISGQQKYEPTNYLLEEPMGLQFPHYWFYKLEYLLWRKMKKERSEEKITSFKITAKNSVEHIAPQNPRGGKTKKELPKELLDSFGNLALVSRSLNSSLSNSTYKVKKEKFNESNEVRNRIESLKLLRVYESDKDDWQEEVIKLHKNEMTQYYDEYLETCKREYEKLRAL
ncbi:DUF262 domain-containing protein [Aliifodinibius salipaludis]|nr:DUF262 domain-containing protein [Aliifodinibius salipaludis]